ncbi:conserved hypothetical protein [Bradyrhizobium sp. STM 3843]|uniref:hypothetical protein n=1 Tax=Bradyrhizobium sp. STM 3843 TaxID=551947 RepID=UPI000240A940|nr:hypothetical protein [Bradyrhizobium sp. STM 3843]CCE06132.1 conserved hypothetical protein [Bradyrhizobium sp. STM 3843]
MMPPLGIRWTIGDVNPAGFDALRLSIHGAMRLFGSEAAYRIYVNTIPVDEARRRVGAIADAVQWLPVDSDIPPLLRTYLGDGMAEGVAWKLLPLRAFPDQFELSLDNDVILWRIPPAMTQWLRSGDAAASLIAADVAAAFGQFTDLCAPVARNSGIRGLGPATAFERGLERVLRIKPVALRSELDEQGLQIAVLDHLGSPLLVETSEVTICSPFYPHDPELGRSGAHFVGLNTRVLPWDYYGKPATEVRLAHWHAVRPQVHERLGLDPPQQ